MCQKPESFTWKNTFIGNIIFRQSVKLLPRLQGNALIIVDNFFGRLGPYSNASCKRNQIFEGHWLFFILSRIHWADFFMVDSWLLPHIVYNALSCTTHRHPSVTGTKTLPSFQCYTSRLNHLLEAPLLNGNWNPSLQSSFISHCHYSPDVQDHCVIVWWLSAFVCSPICHVNPSSWSESVLQLICQCHSGVPDKVSCRRPHLGRISDHGDSYGSRSLESTEGFGHAAAMAMWEFPNVLPSTCLCEHIWPRWRSDNQVYKKELSLNQLMLVSLTLMYFSHTISETIIERNI